MNLRELIESEGLRDETDYEAIADALNARPLIENPTPQGEIADPPTMGELQGIVASGATAQQDLAVVGAIAALVKDGEALARYTGLKNEDSAAALLPMMQAYGLSDDSAQAIEARLAQTKPDPAYQAQVSGISLAEQNGLSVIKPEQVQEAFIGWVS